MTFKNYLWFLKNDRALIVKNQRWFLFLPHWKKTNDNFFAAKTTADFWKVTCNFYSSSINFRVLKCTKTSFWKMFVEVNLHNWAPAWFLAGFLVKISMVAFHDCLTTVGDCAARNNEDNFLLFIALRNWPLDQTNTSWFALRPKTSFLFAKCSFSRVHEASMLHEMPFFEESL